MAYPFPRVIYTDASVRRGVIGVGIVVTEEGSVVDTLTLDGAGSVDSTDGEMLAIWAALTRRVADGAAPRIVTDSQSLHRILDYRAQVLSGSKIELCYRNRLDRWMGVGLFCRLVDELDRTKADVVYMKRCSNEHMRHADKLAKQAVKGIGFAGYWLSDGQAAPPLPVRRKPRLRLTANFVASPEQERKAIQRAHRLAARDFRGGGWCLD